MFPTRVDVKFRSVISRGAETNGTSANATRIRQYAAFPGIARLSDGTLLAVFFRGFGHNDPGSHLAINRSLDGGHTWGNVALDEEVFYKDPDTTLTSTAPAIAVLSTGRIIISYVITGYTAGPQRRSFIRYSDDNGATWSHAIELPRIGTLWTTAAGKVIELDSGRLLAPVYWRNTGESRYRCSLIYSDDQGKTWSVGATFASAAGSTQYEEPVIGKLLDGRLMAMVRTDSPRKIWTTFSSNEGQTWTALTEAFSGWGFCSWAQMTNGWIVAVNRKDGGSSGTWTTSVGIFRVSRDYGVTWDAEQKLQDTSYEEGPFVYADLIEIAPNELGCVHSQEWLAAPQARARLEFMRLGIVQNEAVDVFGSQLEMHYEFEAIKEFPNVTGATTVNGWSDTSGNARHLAVAAAANSVGFTYKFGGVDNSFKGLGILQKDGNSRYQASGTFTIPQPFTVFLVFQSNNPNGDLALFDNGNGNYSCRRDGNRRLYLAAGGNAYFAGVSTWPTGAAVLTVTYNGNSSIIRINGVAQSMSGGPPGTNSMTGFRLNGADGIVNEVREIVIVRSATSQQILDMEAILAHKHRING